LEVIDVGLQPLSGDRLRALKREAVSTRPDLLGENTEGARNTEQDSVVLVLSETVVGKEDTRVGINVGPRVLGLTVLLENIRGNLVDTRDDLEERIVGHVLLSELTLASEARIGLTEDGVTVSRNNLTGVEGIPQSLANLIVSGIVGAELLLEADDPAENLLVSQTVERTSKAVQTSGEREVRIRESRANQVGGVGRHVTTLVIGVDGEIQTHHLIESMALESEHAREVGRPIKLGVAGTELSILVDVSVDACGYLGQVGDKSESILVGVVPVLTLLDTTLVGLSELRLRLHGNDSGGEL